MGVIVPFVYADWVAQYPQFSLIPQFVVENTFYDVAVAFFRNDGVGPVSTALTQTTGLYLMIAHMAQITYGPNTATPSGGLVGRISQATQGSVSVTSDFPTTPTNAWFMQSQYGATFWQLTAAYRTMRYMPGPTRIFNPWPNQ